MEGREKTGNVLKVVAIIFPKGVEQVIFFELNNIIILRKKHQSKNEQQVKFKGVEG